MNWRLPLCELPPQSSSGNYGDTLGLVAEVGRGFSGERMKVMIDSGFVCVRGVADQWVTADCDLGRGQGRMGGGQFLKRSEATNVEEDPTSSTATQGKTCDFGSGVKFDLILCIFYTLEKMSLTAEMFLSDVILQVSTRIIRMRSYDGFNQLKLII